MRQSKWFSMTGYLQMRASVALIRRVDELVAELQARRTDGKRVSRADVIRQALEEYLKRGPREVA